MEFTGYRDCIQAELCFNKPVIRTISNLTLPAIIWFIFITTLFNSVISLGYEKQTDQNGLLWKIAKPGTEPSYLFGTIHLNDERVKNLAPPIKTAFENSKSFTMEMITDTNSLAVTSKVMFLDEGLSLKRITGEKLYQETIRVLLKRGMTTENLDRIKPWVIVMMLNTPKAKSGLFLDMDLYLKAFTARKPTYGLETMAEQLAPFDNMLLKDQVALLKDSLKANDQQEVQLEEITQAYLERNLTKLLTIADSYQTQAGAAYDELMVQLIGDRNLRMQQRMQKRLSEGNAFIAVGALHLPGENGLIKLLQKQGYSVTSVY